MRGARLRFQLRLRYPTMTHTETPAPGTCQ